MKQFVVIGLCLALVLVFPPQKVQAAFGVTSSGGNFVVDTGAGLVFRVNQSNGDINSIVFNGVEYQSTTRGTHIASGLGSDTTVSATVYGSDYAKITIATSPGNGVVSSLTHYLMVKNGDNTIYMATHTTAQPGVGELRWITRLRTSLLYNGPGPSDNRGNIGAVESTDVFRMADNTTRSKYYGDAVTRGKDRAMDLTYNGATGSGVGVWMVYDALREGASGGPFYRDIQNQCGGTDQEIYNYMNSGHTQTEAYRVNGVLHGPYALVFNNGVPPVLPLDYSWIETGGLNLLGWVSAAARGVVAGTATGVPAGFQAVVGFANADAQYWTVATNGTYTSPRMKPGTYTATLYKQELAVATAPVVVTTGTTTGLNLASTEANPAFIFRLGNWDGTPAGFRNADSIVVMHPGDARNLGWEQTDFTIEHNPTAQFPAIQARAVNGNLTLRFTLTPAQAAVGHTLRIGITCAYIGGRPKIDVNGWQSANPAASSQPNTRSFTIGTWRGNNALYTYSVPASAFVAGENVLTIFPISGSSDLGGWLSAGYVFDCIQLDGTPAEPLPPPDLVAALNPSEVRLAWTPVFNAASYKIKRATTSGGPYTTIATNVVARFADPNVAVGTRYYYVVSAVNSVGESANSAEVVAGINPALTVYLPFNENGGPVATDATGNGWNGTLQGGASWTAGQYGSAVNLNGANNYVSLPTGVVSGLEDFTIATWVFQSAVSTWSRVFDFGTDTTSYMFLTPRAQSGSGPVRFAISMASSGGEQQISGTVPLPTGWQHVAVTLQGHVGILYVNGVRVGTNNAMTLKPALLNPTPQNYLGRSQWGPDPYLNGRVDDFRIYNGALSAAQIAALVATPPFAPANLTGTPLAANQINLSWNAAAGATDYNVLRSTTNGGPYSKIATGLPTTSYADGGLDGNTTYYYVVSAVDSIGAELYSSQIAVTTSAGPAPPTGLSAIALVPGQVQLTWDASAVATNYLVKRAVHSDGPYTIIATNATMSYPDSGLVGGWNYYYVVASLGSGGVGVDSAPAGVLALPTLHAYLTFDEASGVLAADATGNGWNGTLINGATRVAGYSNNAVNLSSGANQHVTLPAGLVGSLGNFTIATWVNQASISTWSRIFDFGTGQTVNMFLTPRNGGNNLLRFAITTGGGDGEEQIDGTAALPTGVWKHVAVTLHGSTGVLYVDGVPVGTNNSMTLTPASFGPTTLNYIGRSQYSDPYLNGRVDEFRIYSGALSAGEVATLVTPLAAPANLLATAGDAQVTLNWNVVLNAGRYQILRAESIGGPFTPIAIVTTPTFTDVGLANGTNYFYTVQAANAAGESTTAPPVSARPVSLTPPICTLVSSGNELQLAWPATHIGWRLEAQTNSLAIGLSATWFPVTGSATTNQIYLPLHQANESVFFRLVYP